MRIYKKIAALALSGVMTLGLMAGCSTTETETTPTTAPTVNQATSPTESEGASEANGLNAPITVISREEAEALLAGVVLDTKHFTQRTGGRTFEAAAFLRRAGADTAEVQRLFQNDLKDMVTKYDIIRRAEMYRENIAVAVVEEPGVDRVAAAQAADELLTLKGVQASFVIYAADGAVLISARSLGEINVQVILEALGGGGNSTTAGGRVEDSDPESVRQQLIGVLDAYFEK